MVKAVEEAENKHFANEENMTAVAAKDNLEKKISSLEKDRKSLRREIDVLRDELADSRRAAAEDEETTMEARY